MTVRVSKFFSARGFDYPPDWGSDDGYGEDDGF